MLILILDAIPSSFATLLYLLIKAVDIFSRKFVKSFLQGFVPGLALKIFLWLLPAILMVMSKIEGHVAISVLERKTAAKYYYFMLVNVFLGSIVTGTAFQQLNAFLNQSATE